VLRPHPTGAAFGDGCPDNLLVQGDNLEALKALLPFHRGRAQGIARSPGRQMLADSSGGRALFLMAYKLEQGLNVRQQLDVGLSQAAIESPDPPVVSYRSESAPSNKETRHGADLAEAIPGRGAAQHRHVDLPQPR
jgi:hypothetical protein